MADVTTYELEVDHANNKHSTHALSKFESLAAKYVNAGARRVCIRALHSVEAPNAPASSGTSVRRSQHKTKQDRPVAARILKRQVVLKVSNTMIRGLLGLGSPVNHPHPQFIFFFEVFLTLSGCSKSECFIRTCC